MGIIYAEIELANGEDIVLARRNFIGEDENKSPRGRADGLLINPFFIAEAKLGVI